jgi:hypothetical protein
MAAYLVSSFSSSSEGALEGHLEEAMLSRAILLVLLQVDCSPEGLGMDCSPEALGVDCSSEGLGVTAHQETLVMNLRRKEMRSRRCTQRE